MGDKIRIYAMTHKRFDESNIDLYKPLFVGAAGKDNTYGYLRDDEGDNISSKNCYYSELTGIYYIYKNVTDVDIIGTCHYRRYLVDDNDSLLNKEQIVGFLEEYDCITSKCLNLNYTYYYGFSENHKPYYLDETRKVISRIYPDYLEDYDRLVNDKGTFFGNIMIARRELFCNYCKWLFDILFELEDNIVIEEEDSYHRRIFGFISEFLWYLWVVHNNIKAKELKIGIVGEKIEIKAVREGLREFFRKGDVDGAKAYFLEERKKRPDMMMEASDITGELHICMEAIAVSSLEKEQGIWDSISKIRDYDKIITYFVKLNEVVIAGAKEDMEKLRGIYSEIAIEVALRMYR
ncbi:MAG TPA: capsular biosynthesis protein [Lachnospiraceae bacterium]|nr:capsular biosynthesis protein [Lachnospiraceae bacterium]